MRLKLIVNIFLSVNIQAFPLNSPNAQGTNSHEQAGTHIDQAVGQTSVQTKQTLGQSKQTSNLKYRNPQRSIPIEDGESYSDGKFLEIRLMNGLVPRTNLPLIVLSNDNSITFCVADTGSTSFVLLGTDTAFRLNTRWASTQRGLKGVVSRYLGYSTPEDKYIGTTKSMVKPYLYDTFPNSKSNHFQLKSNEKTANEYSGGSAYSGTWAQDKFSFNSEFQMIAGTSVPFTYVSSGSKMRFSVCGFVCENADDGCILTYLKQNGQIARRSVSVFLNPENEFGSILFGGVDRSKFNGPMTMVPMDEDKRVELSKYFVGGIRKKLSRPMPVLFDSGTTYLNLPIELDIGLGRDSNNFYYGDCKNGEDLQLDFNGYFVDIPYSELLFGIPSTDGIHCQLRIKYDKNADHAVLGTPAFYSTYTYFDFESKRMGLASAVRHLKKPKFYTSSPNFVVPGIQGVTGGAVETGSDERIQADGIGPKVNTQSGLEFPSLQSYQRTNLQSSQESNQRQKQPSIYDKPSLASKVSSWFSF